MNSLISVCRNVFLAKIPFYLLTLILVGTLCGIYFLFPFKEAGAANNATVTAESAECISSMNIVRLKDYKLIKPIILTDINQESSSLEETKSVISNVIQQQQLQGNIQTASIYLRKFSDGSWITINGNERFAPGSLMKIPILITYLKQSEVNSSLLQKEILFQGYNSKMPLQNFTENKLIPGTKYKVRNLLERMIVDSDNEAVVLLQSNLNVTAFKKLFVDLNLPEPIITQKDYFVNPSDCAKFMRILYNGTYLSHAMSEFALDLLSNTKFKDGMKKEIPDDVRVAHKFGESGVTGADIQLHEEGIFYIDNNPYLLVVMTKGRDFSKLATAISAISNSVYQRFSGATG